MPLGKKAGPTDEEKSSSPISGLELPSRSRPSQGGSEGLFVDEETL